MASAQFNLNNFVSTIKKNSLARTNRFEVVIHSPPLLASTEDRLISLLAEQSSLPPISLNIRSHKVWGPTWHRPQSIEYGGEGISFTFHVDRDMRVKRYFDAWMHTVINKDNYTVSYMRDYATIIDIHQLDEKNKITYTAQLRNAFPRNYNLMELNNASQNQTHRLVVTFAYEKWVDPASESKQSAGIPQSQLAPQVPRRDSTGQSVNRNKIPPLSSGRVPPRPFKGGGGEFGGGGADGSY